MEEDSDGQNITDEDPEEVESLDQEAEEDVTNEHDWHGFGDMDDVENGPDQVGQEGIEQQTGVSIASKPEPLSVLSPAGL